MKLFWEVTQQQQKLLCHEKINEELQLLQHGKYSAFIVWFDYTNLATSKHGA